MPQHRRLIDNAHSFDFILFAVDLPDTFHDVKSRGTYHETIYLDINIAQVTIGQILVEAASARLSSSQASRGILFRG